MPDTRAVWLLASALITAIPAHAQAVRDGDIVFQTSRSDQSIAVQQATDSPYSHMGLVIFRGGQPFVFEAGGRVQYTPLQTWTTRGVDGRFAVKRLRSAPGGLKKPDVERLKRAAKQFEGLPYDFTFGWSDDRIYCSELVWKIYDRALGVRLAELQKIRDFNLGAPAVKQKLHERYGQHIPFDEPAVSPAALFASPMLISPAGGPAGRRH